MDGDTDPFMLKLRGAFIVAITVGDIDADGPMYLGDADDVDNVVSLLLPEPLLAGDDDDDSDMTTAGSSVTSSSSDSVKSMTSSLAGESTNKARQPSVSTNLLHKEQRTIPSNFSVMWYNQYRKERK